MPAPHQDCVRKRPRTRCALERGRGLHTSPCPNASKSERGRERERESNSFFTPLSCRQERDRKREPVSTWSRNSLVSLHVVVCLYVIICLMLDQALLREESCRVFSSSIIGGSPFPSDLASMCFSFGHASISLPWFHTPLQASKHGCACRRGEPDTLPMPRRQDKRQRESERYIHYIHVFKPGGLYRPLCPG